MKIYELFEHEGRDVFGLFMALRAITQKPLQYFSENKKELEKFLDTFDPIHPLPGRAYLSTDYRALVNLGTHAYDLEDDLVIKNSVLAVFFVRFLKFAGYFGSSAGSKPKPMGAKTVPDETEIFMLRLAHQLINIQSFNSHSVHEMTTNFEWEKIGTSINPSLALVNHSCDSNAIRCNLNKNSILVAGRHIKEGEEITDSYTVHFRGTSKNQRQYHTLKNYLFSCECSACLGNWPMEDEVPDMLPRIPTLDQEKVFTKRTGDKKDIVKNIVDTRRKVESCLKEKNYEEAIVGYQDLCEQLDQHVRKPHIYFLQARSGLSHCLWNIYCKQKIIAEEEETEDVTGRDHATLIYKSDFAEQANANDALTLGNEDHDQILKENKSEVSEEKKEMMAQVKAMIANSANSLGSLKSDNDNMKANIAAIKSMAKEHANMEKVSGQFTLTTQEISLLIEEQEQEVLQIKKEIENFQVEVKAKETEIKERRKNEQVEQEKKDKLAKEMRNKQREKELEEKMKRYKEEETERKERKRREEEQLKMDKEASRRKNEEEEMKKVFEKQKQRRLELAAEEEELERLLNMTDGDEGEDNFEEQFLDLDSDQANSEVVSSTTPQSSCEWNYESKQKDEVKLNEKISPELEKEFIVHVENKEFETNGGNDNQINKTAIHEEVTEKDPIKTNDNEYNVWTAIREIKEKETSTPLSLKESSTGEVMDTDDIDSYIKELKKMVEAKKAEAMLARQTKAKKADELPLVCIAEESEESSIPKLEEKTEIKPEQNEVHEERMVN